jgi:hypothetical protein
VVAAVLAKGHTSSNKRQPVLQKNERSCLAASFIPSSFLDGQDEA